VTTPALPAVVAAVLPINTPVVSYTPTVPTSLLAAVNVVEDATASDVAIG
jgi:hypothetical protein